MQRSLSIPPHKCTSAYVKSMGPAGITPDFLIFLEFQDVGLHGDIVGEVLLCDPQQA